MTLEELLAENGVSFAVVTDVNGSSWNEFGSREALRFQGLVDQYLSGLEAVPRLVDMLRAAPRPQVVRQGSVSCALCLRDDGAIVVLLRHDELDVFARRRWARGVQTQVESLVILDAPTLGALDP